MCACRLIDCTSSKNEPKSIFVPKRLYLSYLSIPKTTSKLKLPSNRIMVKMV